MRFFATQTTIGANEKAIWDVLTDAAAYPSWNSSVTRVDGRIAPGEKLTLYVKAAPGRAFPVKVVVFERPKQLVWLGGMPLRLFTGRRTFQLRPSNAGNVEFSMREEYTGWLAPLITKALPDLQPAFEEFTACLKTRAERS